MSWTHLAAVVPVAVLGFALLDSISSWAKRRAECRARAELELVHECCCGERRAH